MGWRAAFLKTDKMEMTFEEIGNQTEIAKALEEVSNMPKVDVAQEGLFHKWMKKNNKLGGQHKVPRLSNSRQFLEELLEMN